MDTPWPWTTALLSSSTGRANNSQNIPKLPNGDDIEDLSTHVQERSDILSRLLLNEPDWRKRASYQVCELLSATTIQFCNFCEEAAALLHTANYLSEQLINLFASIVESKRHSTVMNFTNSLQADAESLSTQILAVEQRYNELSSSSRHLMGVAPAWVRTRLSDFREDHRVFERLDGLWKVVATQSSRLTEPDLEPPSDDIILKAKNEWVEYQRHLLRVMDTLRQASDALKASAIEPKYHQKSGRSIRIWFIILWFKLTTRISVRGPES